VAVFSETMPRRCTSAERMTSPTQRCRRDRGTSTSSRSSPGQRCGLRGRSPGHGFLSETRHWPGAAPRRDHIRGPRARILEWFGTKCRPRPGRGGRCSGAAGHVTPTSLDEAREFFELLGEGDAMINQASRRRCRGLRVGDPGHRRGGPTRVASSEAHTAFDAATCTSTAVAASRHPELWGEPDALFQDTGRRLNNVGGVRRGEIKRRRRLRAERVKNSAARWRRTWRVVTSSDFARSSWPSRRSTRLLQINVMDHRGVVLASSSRTGQIESANRIGVAFNLDGKPFASDAYVSPVFNDYVVYLSTRSRRRQLRHRGGERSLRPSRFPLTHARPHQVRRDAYTMLATSEGRVLAHPVADRINDDVSTYPAVRGRSGARAAGCSRRTRRTRNA